MGVAAHIEIDKAYLKTFKHIGVIYSAELKAAHFVAMAVQAYLKTGQGAVCYIYPSILNPQNVSSNNIDKSTLGAVQVSGQSVNQTDIVTGKVFVDTIDEIDSDSVNGRFGAMNLNRGEKGDLNRLDRLSVRYYRQS